MEGFVLPVQTRRSSPICLRRMRHPSGALLGILNRAEHGDANDTRDTIARIAQLRAQTASCSGIRTSLPAIWKNQMAETRSRAEVHRRAGAPGNGQGSQRSPGHPGRD